MTMRIRAAMLLLVGLACASAAWAQAAVQADNAQVDPKVWGVYATLAGQERQQEDKADTYLMRWRWLEPGTQLREEYLVPSTGKLAHYNTITPGATPGTLHLKASYMGGKEWNGTLDADGTVHWVGKGLFKLRYAVGPGPGGALLYGMEGQEPMRLVQIGGAATAAAPALAQAATVPAPATGTAPTGATATGEHAANAAALQAQARDLRALEASAAAQRKAAEAAGQATLAALQAEVQVKAAAAAAEVEAQARVQAQLAASAPPQAQAQGAVAATPAAVAQATGASVPMQPEVVPAEPIVPDAAPTTAAARSTTAPVAGPVRATTAASPTDGFTPGTYVLDGGSYVIEVQRDGDGLLVVEPNKRSPYAWASGRDFHFYNPNTDTTYGIRVLDARTIEAFKPFVDGNVPSRLTLLSATATDTPQEDLGDPGFEAIAEKYASMIETDPANVQAWSACAAAAMKYSMATVADADAYATQMIGMLRLMDVASTPCEDALPSRLW